MDSAAEDDQLILESDPWEDLVALTAAHGIWLVADGTTDLADVAKRCARPERRRAAVLINAEDPTVAGAQAAAAVLRILQEFQPAAAEQNPNLRATLVPGSPTHEIRLSPPAGWSPGSAPIVTLVCEAAPGIVVEQRDSGTVLRVASRETVGSGWL